MSMLRRVWRWAGHADGPRAGDFRRHQITSLAKRTPVLVGASLVNVMATAIVFWPITSHHLVAGWAAVVILAVLYPLRGWLRYRDRQPVDVDPGELRRAALQALIIGLAWGGGAVLLYPPQSIGHQFFLAVVIAGSAAGGATAMASVPAAAVAFIGASIGPLFVRLMVHGEPLQLMLAAMALALAVVALATTRTVFGSIAESIRNKLQNAALLDQLQAARADLLDAIASTSEGFALFDSQNRLLLCNDKFGRLLSLTPERLVKGQPYESLLRAGAPPIAVHAGQRSLDDWVVERMQRHRLAAGSFNQQLANGRWLHTSDRRTSRGGTVTVHVDITELKENEAALNRAKENAESASGAKSEFLAMVSHELRTPLSAIMGFSEILKDELFGPHADPHYKEYAADIHTSGGHLLQVINDILDLSKIEAGKFELHEQLCEPDALIHDVTRMMGERARNGGLALDLDLPSALPVLFADARAIKQMLVNLVSNAIKFTPSGGRVTIAAAVKHDGLDIAVRDTGVGIAEPDMAKVLEPFGQIDGGAERDQPGTGLGVPLVRSLIDLHGGTFRIDSVVGRGTTVTLHFATDRLRTRDAA